MKAKKKRKANSTAGSKHQQQDLETLSAELEDSRETPPKPEAEAPADDPPVSLQQQDVMEAMPLPDMTDICLRCNVSRKLGDFIMHFSAEYRWVEQTFKKMQVKVQGIPKGKRFCAALVRNTFWRKKKAVKLKFGRENAVTVKKELDDGATFEASLYLAVFTYPVSGIEMIGVFGEAVACEDQICQHLLGNIAFVPEQLDRPQSEIQVIQETSE